MSMDISNISSVTSKPVSRPENSDSQGKFFNLLVSQDRDGAVFHELCLTTGNIDTCRISSLDDAKNIMNSGETFKIAQPDPSLPKHLRLITIA